MRIFDYLKMNLNLRPVVSILVACLLAGILVGARPGYQAIKAWRSDRLIAKSQISLEKESFTEAFYQAHTATLLHSDEESARNFAQIGLKVGYPLSNKLWSGLLDSPYARSSDWRQAVESSVRLGDLSMGFDYLLRWRRAGVEDPYAYDTSRALVLFANGQDGEAKALLSQSLELGEVDERSILLYRELLNRSGTEDEKAAFSQLIEAWSSRSDEVGKLALQNLANDESLPEAERKAAANALLDHPLSKFDERLRIVSTQVKLGWEPFSKLDEMYSTHASQSGQDYLADFTTILCDLDRYGQVVDMVDPELIREDRIVLRNWLVAKLGIGDTDTVLKSTGDDEERGTSIAEESLLRALAFKESGDGNRYESNLFESVEKAGSEDIAFLESHFVKLGETDALLKLYEKLSLDPQLGQQARLLWLQLAISQKDETAMFKALDGMASISARQRADMLARNLYMRLILGMDLEETRRQIEYLVSHQPQNPSYRLLLAFAHLKSANLAQAQQLAQTVRSEGMQVDTRQALILAALWDQFGDPEQASRFVEQIAKEELLPSELTLLNSIGS